MRYLLDSHVVLWASQDAPKLSQIARRTLEDPASRLVVSVATLWEIELKHSRGRLHLPGPFDHFADAIIDALDLQVLSIQRRHVDAGSELPRRSTDPFDHMIAAQALAEDVPLITADTELHGYPIRTVW